MKNSPAYFNSIKENWKGGTVILDIENRVREGGPNKIDREILVIMSDEGEGINTKIVAKFVFQDCFNIFFKRNRVRIVYL